jgi:hypothetical protein
MRLLTLPITIVRVPIEFGFGAAKQAVKFAQGLVGGGEEPVVEETPPAPAPRRRSPARRSGNSRASAGRPGTRRAGTGRARKRATPTPPVADEPAPRATPTSPVADEPAGPAPTTAVATPPPPTAEPAPPADPAVERVAEPPPAAEPTHVSEEPELVAEAAEAGAEDGAGAEVAVGEPWPGYDEMNAPDIEDRLVGEGPETAAAVRLYEASRKGRASILEAASRTMTT